jgi:23S rRNA pseudouridine1911/1915/1917 synthase
VKGIPKEKEGIIEVPIGRSYRGGLSMRLGGKKARIALTKYRLEEILKEEHSLLSVIPQTGRTHQIRVHLAKSLHLPIIGDKEYGVTSIYIKRSALHAHRLAFTHPREAKEVSFAAKLPADMQLCLDNLRNKKCGSS